MNPKKGFDIAQMHSENGSKVSHAKAVMPPCCWSVILVVQGIVRPRFSRFYIILLGFFTLAGMSAAPARCRDKH